MTTAFCRPFYPSRVRYGIRDTRTLGHVNAGASVLSSHLSTSQASRSTTCNTRVASARGRHSFIIGWANCLFPFYLFFFFPFSRLSFGPQIVIRLLPSQGGVRLVPYSQGLFCLLQGVVPRTRRAAPSIIIQAEKKEPTPFMVKDRQTPSSLRPRSFTCTALHHKIATKSISLCHCSTATTRQKPSFTVYQPTHHQQRPYRPPSTPSPESHFPRRSVPSTHYCQLAR